MRAEDAGQRPDPRWTVLIRSEMDTWMPERLPERFVQQRPKQVAWRRMALAIAVVVVGLVSLSLLPGPSTSLPIVREVHMIVTGILGVPPTPSGRSQVTLPPGARPPAGVAPSGRPAASPSPAADQTGPPQGNAGSSPTSSPGGLLGLPLPSLPPLLPTPTPTPAQPAPTPTPRKCILGIICL